MNWNPLSLVAMAMNAMRGIDRDAPEPEPPPGLQDLRKKASKEHVYGRRLWRNVTGICLHQTACLLGERPKEDEPWKRWYGVGCHLGVTRSGNVPWLHGFDRLVVHGNGWNAQTVSIEVDGLYAGIEGDPSTVWDDPDTDQREQGMTLTPAAAAATRRTIRWICSVVAQHGGQVRALVAHRQSSGTRRNDPGSAIWQAVALPLHDELGLSDGGKGFQIGAGFPVPEAWNPNYKGVRY